MKQVLFSNNLFRVTMGSLLLAAMVFTQGCKKEDPDDTTDNNNNTGGNTKKESTVVIFAKPKYCADYVGELTIKVDGETKGTISTCHEDRSCGETGAITVTLADGEHKLEAVSSSYSNSLTLTLDQQQCYKWALD